MRDVWITVAASAISCVVLMASFWMVTAKDYVTRTQVSDMIQTESPYLVDKQLVLENINEMKEVLRKNTEVISQLNLEIARLRTELDRLDQP